MLSLLLIGLVAAFQMTSTRAGSGSRIVCYQSHWYRQSSDKFSPGNIEPFMCTHLIYAFAEFSGDNMDPYEWTQSAEWSADSHEKITNVTNTNPNLKVLLSVGNWIPRSTFFTQALKFASERQNFVTNTINCLRMGGFDGLALDLDHQNDRGNTSEDKQAISDLIKDLKQAFVREFASTNKSRLLLTAAVSARKITIDAVYDVPIFSQELDFITLLAFNLGGNEVSVTSHKSPLYARSDDTGARRYLNVDWAAKYWVEKGADKSKLSIGMALYGSSYTLANAASFQLGAPTSSHGESDLIGYFEVCELLKAGGQMVYNSEQRVPFAHLDNQWVSYENADSLREKVRYVKDNNFGGVMVWALDLDDFKGSYCGQGRYPLMTTIVDEYRRTVALPSTPGIPTQTQAPSGTVDKEFCIKRKSGSFADPSDCANFIMCSNGIVHQLKCANGTAWNETIKTCDHVANTSCGHSAK